MPADPPGLRQFALTDIAPEPWRNGGGFTRTLAVGAGASADLWRWRVSVATIEQDGAFSSFPGVDRNSLLIGGGELALDDTRGQTLHLGLHQAVSYAGEASLFARVQGAPLQCLNVMTRRGQCRAHLCTVSQTVSPKGEFVLLVLQGSFGYTTQCQKIEQKLPTAHGLIGFDAIDFVVFPHQPDSLLALAEFDQAAP